MNKCCYKLNFYSMYRAYRPQAIYTILHMYLFIIKYVHFNTFYKKYRRKKSAAKSKME